MDLLTRPATLQNGVTITVQAWPYAAFAANYMDYRNLLLAFRERSGGQEGQQPQQRLLDRVILSCVPREEDRSQIAAADVGELLEVVHDLNQLDEVAAKPLGLYMRLLRAETDTLEASPGATSTTSPT